MRRQKAEALFGRGSVRSMQDMVKFDSNCGKAQYG